jgi:transcriptional regulator with XRE-family HTH domain
MTQAALAAKMQLRGHATMVDRRIHEIEHGRRYIRHDELVSFARVFKIPITELLGVPDYDPKG